MRSFILFCVVFFASCAEGDDVPEGLLDRETFKSVLIEAQMIEARMNHEISVQRRKETPVESYYDEVFEAHNTDREQFERTFSYYSSRPVELRTIYEEIITELSRRKDLVPLAEPVPPAEEGATDGGEGPGPDPGADEGG